MSEVMVEEIKRWTAQRKSARVLEIIHDGAQASQQFDRWLRGHLRVWRTDTGPALLRDMFG